MAELGVLTYVVSGSSRGLLKLALLPEPTPTGSEASDDCGSDLSEIVRSLSFLSSNLPNGSHQTQLTEKALPFSFRSPKKSAGRLATCSVREHRTRESLASKT